jgi:hypothetical protein
MREIAHALEEISTGLLRLSRALLEAEHADTDVLPSLPRSNAGPAHSRAAQDEEARKQTSDDGEPAPASAHAQSEGFVTATGAEDGRDPADSAPELDAPLYVGLKRKPRLIDEVLDLYASTDMSAAAISGLINCAETSVSVFLTQARKAGDERVKAGDAARGRVIRPKSPSRTAELHEQAIEQYASTLLSQKTIGKSLGLSGSAVSNAVSAARHRNDERVAKGDMARQVAAREIRVSRNQLAAAPSPPPPAPPLPRPDKVLVADESKCTIYGPKDAVTLSRPVVRTLGQARYGRSLPCPEPWLRPRPVGQAPDRLREALSVGRARNWSAPASSSMKVGRGHVQGARAGGGSKMKRRSRSLSPSWICAWPIAAIRSAAKAGRRCSAPSRALSRTPTARPMRGAASTFAD